MNSKTPEERLRYKAFARTDINEFSILWSFVSHLFFWPRLIGAVLFLLIGMVITNILCMGY